MNNEYVKYIKNVYLLTYLYVSSQTCLYCQIHPKSFFSLLPSDYFYIFSSGLSTQDVAHSIKMPFKTQWNKLPQLSP